MDFKNYHKKSLENYLIPKNESSVLKNAKNISVMDLSTEYHKKVVIPIAADSNLLRRATLSLLQDQTWGKYGLFKVDGKYQAVSSYEPGVESIIKGFSSEDRVIWNVSRSMEMPSELNSKQKVEWAKDPNIAQRDLNIKLEKKICFGDGREPLIPEKGRVFMEVYSDQILPIKTFLTPPEMTYIDKLQKGK